MIRINLLPVRQQRRRTAGRTQLLLFIAAIIAEIAVIFAVNSHINSKLEEVENDVSQAQQAVDRAKREIAQAKVSEKKAENLQKRLDVIEKLNARRTGPVRVLDELQMMLSKPRDQRDEVSQLKKNWNPQWEPGRLWLTKFTESEGAFDIEGSAMSPDDVAEFLQRLTTGEHFSDVELDYVKSAGQKGASGRSGPRVVNFHVTGNLSYRGKSAEAQDAADKQQPGRGGPPGRKTPPGRNKKGS